MSMRLALALSAILSLCAAPAARADDDGGDESPWSGFYLGADAGLTRTNLSYTHSETGSVDDLSQTSIGRAMGLEIGWQRQWGHVVAGVDASFTDLAHVEAKDESPTQTGRTRTSAARELWAVTARLGYVHQNWMIFAKAGWANADLDQVNIVTVSKARISEFGGRANGALIGGGFEYALYPSVILGSEYDWVSLSSGGTLTPSFQAPGVPADEADTNVSASLFVSKARLIFKIAP